MGKWDSITRLFVTEVEDEPQPTAESPGLTPTASASPIQSAVAPAATNVDQKFLERIRSEVARQSGETIKQFIKLYGSMSMIPDEKTRFLATFSALQSQSPNISAMALIADAERSLEILGSEQKEFEGDMAKMEDEQIGQKKGRIEAIEKQVAELRTTISQLEKEKSQIQLEIGTVQNKIDSSKSNFATAFQVVKAELEGNILKLKSYLKA